LVGYKGRYIGNIAFIEIVMHNAAGQRGRPTLAHLLAALSTAPPKQAKEPIFDLTKKIL